MREADLITYFNEHVVYELLMLRYCQRKLDEIHIVTREDQLQWNAMFAAFNVSARNLYEFFNGDDNKNRRLAEYRPYSRNFELKDLDFIKGKYQDLHRQCLHLGKLRTKEAAEKLTHGDVREMHQWVESNMAALIESFNEGFRSKIDLSPAEWSPTPPAVIYKSGPTGPGLMLRIPEPNPATTTSAGSDIHTTNTIPPNQNPGHK